MPVFFADGRFLDANGKIYYDMYADIRDLT